MSGDSLQFSRNVKSWTGKSDRYQTPKSKESPPSMFAGRWIEQRISNSRGVFARVFTGLRTVADPKSLGESDSQCVTQICAVSCSKISETVENDREIPKSIASADS